LFGKLHKLWNFIIHKTNFKIVFKKFVEIKNLIIYIINFYSIFRIIYIKICFFIDKILYLLKKSLCKIYLKLLYYKKRIALELIITN